jgi:hypothetical protein
VKGIISIPIFEVPHADGKSTPAAIGVLNIDTDDENVIKRWKEDERFLSSTIDIFENPVKFFSYFL